MAASLQKHTTAILLFMLLVFYLLGWLFPALRTVFAVVLIVTGFALACYTAIEKQRQAYFRAEITRERCIRNVIFEVSGVALAMVCAALLGRYLAEVATRQVEPYLARFVLSTLAALGVGVGVGFGVRKVWKRFTAQEHR